MDNWFWPDPSELDLGRRLIASLADTRIDEPRPLSPLDLPARTAHLLSADVLANLRRAAVLVPVMARAEGLRVLLTVRSEALKRHAGQISFPGGSQDAGDADVVDTALRESQEEIGLHRSQVRVIGFLDDYPTITGFRITPVVGLIAAGATIQPDGVEVSEVFEVPLPLLLNKRQYQRRTLEHDGEKLPYYAFEFGGHTIWGATAAMLDNLRATVTGEK